MTVEENDDYYDDYCESSESCPNCGRMYDDIGFDYQYCKVCGWDANNEEFEHPVEPTEYDYMSGEADLLTGEWI